MVVSTPIKDETGNVFGVFAMRLNLDRLLRAVKDWSGLGRTGETIIAREIDGEIIFMAPTRHDYNAALTSVPRQLKPLREAARGASGTGRITDYREREGLGAWEHIPDLNWGLMVKIDQREADQPYKEAQLKTVLLTVIILSIAVLLSFYIASALVRPLKELQAAAERISKGDLDVKLSIHSSDEIGELANSFGRMIASIKFLMEEKRQQQELRLTLSELYEDILRITRDYMGIVADSFVKRRCKNSLDLDDPRLIQANDLDLFTNGVAQTGEVYMEAERGREFVAALTKLKSKYHT